MSDVGQEKREIFNVQFGMKRYEGPSCGRSAELVTNQLRNMHYGYRFLHWGITRKEHAAWSCSQILCVTQLKWIPKFPGCFAACSSFQRCIIPSGKRWRLCSSVQINCVYVFFFSYTRSILEQAILLLIFISSCDWWASRQKNVLL